MKKEAEVLESLKKQADADFTAQRKKTEDVICIVYLKQIKAENATLKRMLDAQASETATAQASIDKMHQGNFNQ